MKRAIAIMISIIAGVETARIIKDIFQEPKYCETTLTIPDNGIKGQPATGYLIANFTVVCNDPDGCWASEWESKGIRVGNIYSICPRKIDIDQIEYILYRDGGN